MNDNKALEKYVDKGKSEIHWDSEKIFHFALIECLLKTSHKSEIMKAGNFLSMLDLDVISSIINTIDSEVPSMYSDYCIPVSRKQLIINTLALRTTALSQILRYV